MQTQYLYSTCTCELFTPASAKAASIALASHTDCGRSNLFFAIL